MLSTKSTPDFESHQTTIYLPSQNEEAMNCKKFFSFQILIFIFVILPCSVQATLTSITNCTGEAKNCYVTNNPPEQITKDPNNDLLLAWNEKQNVTLNSDLK